MVPYFLLYLSYILLSLEIVPQRFANKSRKREKMGTLVGYVGEVVFFNGANISFNVGERNRL